ncbi:MAG: hypothetical protein PHV37_09025 [Candidatus Gastranaerophilales bacterium]|nr:hypothetical protein [Candidatus Gastranaerophilales bacterium]
MGTRVSQISFTRGEISPVLYSRTDIEQYSLGLKNLKNGFVHQEGCVSNRPGLEFIGEIKDSSKESRLIPFTFNSEQTYVIEAGSHYFRFIKDGGYIIYPSDYGITYVGTYEYVSTGTNDNDDTYYKYKLGNDDVVYTSAAIAADIICYQDENLSKVYQNGSSKALSKGKVTSIDTTELTIGIDENNDKIEKRGEIVEIETPYETIDLPLIKKTQSGDVLTLVHQSYTPKELSRYSHYDWELKDILFEPCITAPTNIAATWHGDSTSNTRSYTYLVTAVDDKTKEESVRSDTVTVTGHREAYWTTSEYFTISWNAVAGACEYNIYRSVNGIFGYVGTSTETSFNDDNIEPDLKESAPLAQNPFEDGNNPGCVGYFQQRKVYANSINNPQVLWASQTATSNNFNISRPLIATDAITIPMSDIQGNEIRHLIPFKDLIVLCQNSEWKINGSDGVFEANPSPLALIQSCYGSSNVQPIISGSMVIFVQSGGSVVRDLGYDYLSDKYDGDELSLFANHLFSGKQVKYIDYAKEPYRLVWVVMNDGNLLGLTYNKKQKLCGWHRHETDGLFESVAVVRENQEDIAYFIVKRVINGSEKRYVERFATRIITNVKDAFLVDCGLSADFATAATEISGLNHLEGKKVIVNADGGIVNNLTVAGGKITLPVAANKVIVGLPYEFELETLNIEGENTQGIKKIINSVSIRIHESREDFQIVGANGTAFQNARSMDSINDSGLLVSTSIDATPFAIPTVDATVHIKQPYPLPITILSLAAVVNLEG